jgi:predicted ArsR family transcriptional regulator
VEETKAKILKVLTAIPQGVLYSTTDWHRLLGDDKREIRRSLDELEAEGHIEIIKSEAGRSDKPLYRLKEEKT